MSAEPTSWALRVETAIGKTAVGLSAVGTAVRQGGLVVVYAVPTHKLGSELVERFAEEGIHARVYRGYEADDPDQPGMQMCHDLAAVTDAQKAGASIKGAVCEQKRPDGETLRCEHFHACGMMRQRRARPQVWIVPHALLFTRRPGFIPEPDALVIDEGFSGGAIPEKAWRLTLDSIERAPIEILRKDGLLSLDPSNDLESARGRLVRALRAHEGDGPVRRDLLLKHGVTKEIASQAHQLEWRRREESCLVPGMRADERRKHVNGVGQHNRQVRLLATMWDVLRDFLADEADASGRLSIRYDEEAGARGLDIRPLRHVRQTWKAPALLLDATLPDPVLLEPVLGHPVEIKASLSAKWSPHGRVRQIVGAPVSASKLGIVAGRESEADKRIIGELLRLIRLRATLAGDRVVAVVGQKVLIEKLVAAGLPANVETGHFGALAGLDHWKSAAGMICIGRPLPSPLAMETAAGVISGRPAVTTSSENGHTRWYERIVAGVRLATGAGIAVDHVRHPDPVAEALRWQACEAQLLQAIGRLRALRRTAETPFFLDLITDVPLPITVDEVTTWEKACPGRWAEMASAGVLLESPADIQAAFPELAPTRGAGVVGDLRLVVTSIGESLIDVTTSLSLHNYKRAGRHSPAQAVVLPNGPADLKAWLEERLGPIEWVRATTEPPPAAPEKDPSPDGDTPTAHDEGVVPMKA